MVQIIFIWTLPEKKTLPEMRIAVRGAGSCRTAFGLLHR
jgi:hypothetical protein